MRFLYNVDNKNVIFIHVVATGNESDKRREQQDFLHKKSRDDWIS